MQCAIHTVRASIQRNHSLGTSLLKAASKARDAESVDLTHCQEFSVTKRFLRLKKLCVTPSVSRISDSRQVFTEAGGSEADAAGDEPAGEESRRRAVQVRRHRASRRAEESSGVAADAGRSLHDMLHVRHHWQSQGRHADASECHGVHMLGNDANGRSSVDVRGFDDQLPAFGAHAGALLRERYVHGRRFRRFLHR